MKNLTHIKRFNESSMNDGFKVKAKKLINDNITD